MPTIVVATNGAVEPPKSKPTSDRVSWGRTHKAKWYNNVVALLIVVAPLWMYLNWLTLEQYGGSAVRTAKAIRLNGLGRLARHHFPQPSLYATAGYALWLLFQAALYQFLPGKQGFGQRTPGGHLLNYTANGLTAWAITHLLFLTAAVLGFLDPAIIAKNWSGIFIAANAYGFFLAFVSLIKGYFAPSYPEDVKLSGSWIFDLWAGVELNPRLGKNFDLKFFHNGRPGIVAWTLIDLSWAAYQYETLGYVTISMVIVLILHTIYAVDFFYNEDWYTRTIDITHDHFGFMLTWGDSTFLPAFYTLQAQYLARYPAHLTTLQSIAVLALGLIGYGIFRLANHEKDYVRSHNGNVLLWGQPATFVSCTYRTSDGKEHKSILLTSGMWGLCRHSNYMGDLIISFAMCAACGVKHLLPWSYFFYMLILLCNRISRDEERCSNKYGEKWAEYCDKVRFRLIPGVY